MATLDAFLDDVLDRALAELERNQLDLFTLAFYLDHESSAVSVCADTAANSVRVVAGINRYNHRYFLEAVRSGDIKQASLWQSNIGRSLSLGDFASRNLAYTDLGAFPIDDTLVEAMLRALVRHYDRIGGLASPSSEVVLVCSTVDDEAGLAWVLPREQSPSGPSI